MNQLPIDKQCLIFNCLAEGNSIRSTARLADVSINAVMRTFVKLGEACRDYQNDRLRNLTCQRLQIDEMHSFVGAKSENISEQKRIDTGWGTVWVWLAIDADTKLVPCWYAGGHGHYEAYRFLSDLKDRLAPGINPQFSTDGMGLYCAVMREVFEHGYNFGQVVKVFGPASIAPSGRFNPAKCTAVFKKARAGKPDPAHISTSYVERLNLTLRMKNRRFARLTNAFSKKMEHHCHSLAIWAMHYNFCRIHQTLRVTPAMEAGLSTHIWEPQEVIALTQKKKIERAA